MSKSSNIKRIVAITLCLLMLFGLLPPGVLQLSALAYDGDTDTPFCYSYPEYHPENEYHIEDYFDYDEEQPYCYEYSGYPYCYEYSYCYDEYSYCYEYCDYDELPEYPKYYPLYPGYPAEYVHLIEFVVDESTIYVYEAIPVDLDMLLEGIRAYDENYVPVSVYVYDFGGLDIYDPQPGGKAGYPQPFIITYKAIHPVTDEPFFTYRELFVTIGVQPMGLGLFMPMGSGLGTQMVVPPFTPDVQVTDWDELRDAVDNAVGSVDIHVMNHIDTSTAIAGNAITIPAGTTVFLRSDPYSANVYSIYQDMGGQRHFIINGGELSIGNIKLTRITPIGAGVSGGIDINGTLEMFTDSVISGASGSTSGAVNLVAGNFTMWDGTISNNSAGIGGFGGGVNVAPGTSFIMKNGTISGNSTAGIGGGVGVQGGTFTMLGGTISGNSATTVGAGIIGTGGGVLVHHGGTFIMEGGTIRDNTAVRGGGVGVTANNIMVGADLTINDGIISGNNATLNGGGIFTQHYNWLTISDAAIFIGNTAASAHDFYLSFWYPSISVPPLQVGAAAMTAWFGGVVPPTIQWYSTSIAGAHLLNNYDVNFIGHAIDYQTVTFDPNGGVFANTPHAQLQGSAISQERWISQVAVGGVTPPLPTYELAFDENGALQNLTLPIPTHQSGFSFGGWFNSAAEANNLTSQAGRVLYTDDVTALTSRTLYARWIQPTGGGGGGGGGWSQVPPPPMSDGNDETPPAPGYARQAYLIGTPDGLIRPNDNITRAEVATIFFRLITDGARAGYWTQSNPYADVRLPDWFNNAVSTMTNAGIFVGRPDGTFAPNQTITRAEMAAVIVRFMRETDDMGLRDNKFSDIDYHWAADYINIAALNGWAQGPHGMGGAFYPERPITRAEAAAMVNRIMGRLQENFYDLLPYMRTWSDNAYQNAWYFFYIQSATNSYTFEWRGIFENWSAIIEPPEWWRLERPYSVPGSQITTPERLALYGDYGGCGEYGEYDELCEYDYY